eukprot:scaffold162063_cov57-Attheya_sp.AAC.1
MSQSSTLFTHLDHSLLIHAAMLKANKTMNYHCGKGSLSSLTDANNSNRHTGSSTGSSDASIDRDIMLSAHHHEWHRSFSACRKPHMME